MNIVIPSHLRAGRVTTTPMILPPDAVVLCVPKAQGAEYREHHPDVEILEHPDEVVGLMPKRQWIVDHFDGDVFMVDDDQVEMIHFEHADAVCSISPDQAVAIIERQRGLAMDLGVFLYGFAPFTEPRPFIPWKAFTLTGYVNGGAFGILPGSKLYYTDELTSASDHWISGLNAHHHRWCLVDRRYGWSSKGNTFSSVGGTAAIRTMDTELHDTEVLRAHFGSHVIIPKRRPPFAPTGQGGHVGQRTFKDVLA